MLRKSSGKANLWILAIVIMLMAVFLTLAVLEKWPSHRSKPSETADSTKVEEENAKKISSHYEVEEIRFDPAEAGRNKVSIKVRNLTVKYQVTATYIQTNSGAAGWGSTFMDNIEPQKEKWCVYHFVIRDKFSDKAWVRLRFYNPAASSFDSIDLDNYFLEKKFFGFQMERRQPDLNFSLPAEPELASAIKARYQQFQDWLRDGNYDEAWKAISLPYQQAEFHGLFEISFKPDLNKTSRKSAQIQSLKMEDVVKKGSLVILNAALESAKWKISFVTDEGQWKIDDIEGYVEQSARDRILSAMQLRKSNHFDIYYKKDTLAERDIDKIARQRDSGYEEIGKFLGITPDVRLSLIFFEDMETKRKETGHQGAGMARGTNIVEVYNNETQLDPYHETTHILASAIGHPPAIFNEGFATYMSERLGKNLGGGDASLYQKVRDLKSKGDWISLKDLIVYDDIGPEWSRPPVSYPEAGAFVKFLIDTYGKEKFLQAYKSLENSKDNSVIEENIKKLEEIYDKPLDALAEEWHKAMGLPVQN